MKHLFCFLAFAFLFTNCNDDIEIVDPSSVIDIERIEGDVRFVDLVLDEDGAPLEGVVVTVYADNTRHTDITDDRGFYDIVVPLADLPFSGFISVSVNAKEYKPYNLTYEAPLIADKTYDSKMPSFRLSPCPTCLDIGVKSSELVHLGDDFYAGSINSQFQKSTDGMDIEFKLEGSEEYTALAISFDVKGIQPDRFEDKSAIQFMSGEEVVGEQLIEMNSPEDGSFETFMYQVDNTQTVTSVKFATMNHGTPGSDYDDWEFTCLYIEGVK